MNLRLQQLSILLILALYLTSVTCGELQAEDKDFQPPDCGLNSLFILLELNGKHVDLNRLRQQLPPQSKKGYSFLELSDAAKALGHRVKGISLEENERMPRDPAIVFLSDRKNGHFVVVKPVEGSDSLIQIYDAPAPTRIVNADIFQSDPHWTGRLLLMESSRFKRFQSMILVMIFLSTLTLMIWVNRKSRTTAINRHESTI